MNTTSLELSCAQLMANWKRREVFPLLRHKQKKYVRNISPNLHCLDLTATSQVTAHNKTE
jgi:hypothetical protein